MTHKTPIDKYLDEIIEKFTATPRIELEIVNYSLRPFKKDEKKNLKELTKEDQ